MRRRWIFVLAVLTAAGCMPKNSAIPPLTPSAVGTPPVQSSPPTSITSAPVQATAFSAPTVPISPVAPTLPNAATLTARTPAAATGTPGTRVTPASSAPTLPPGWKIFSNKTWHIALNYPASWSLHEDSTGASFTAPGGAAIFLAAVSATPGEFGDLPNTRCTTQTNPYGMQARVCFDTIARTYFAYLGIGTGQLPTLTLGMRPPLDLQIFNEMLASVRPTP